MKFLAKTSLLKPRPVHFPDGKYIVFIPNLVFTLSVEQVAYLEKAEKDLFSNLLKLRVSKKQVFKAKPEPEPEPPKELEKLLEDAPELAEEKLVEVELVVGEEPAEEKPKKKRRKSKKTRRHAE